MTRFRAALLGRPYLVVVALAGLTSNRAYADPTCTVTRPEGTGSIVFSPGEVAGCLGQFAQQTKDSCKEQLPYLRAGIELAEGKPRVKRRIAVAECEETLGAWDQMLAETDRCAREVSAAEEAQGENWADVRKQCEVLRLRALSHFGYVKVDMTTDTPPDVRILVGGKQVEQEGGYLEALRLAPGMVRVEAFAPGYALFSQEVEVFVGRQSSVQVRLERLSDPTPPAVLPQQPPATSQDSMASPTLPDPVFRLAFDVETGARVGARTLGLVRYAALEVPLTVELPGFWFGRLSVRPFVEARYEALSQTGLYDDPRVEAWSFSGGVALGGKVDERIWVGGSLGFGVAHLGAENPLIELTNSQSGGYRADIWGVSGPEVTLRVGAPIARVFVAGLAGHLSRTVWSAENADPSGEAPETFEAIRYGGGLFVRFRPGANRED